METNGTEGTKELDRQWWKLTPSDFA